MSVIFTILRVLGIIILVLLCIVIALLLLVLLVPIRYRGRIAYKDQADGEVHVTWLLHLLHFRLLLQNNKPSMDIRIFGIKINGRKKAAKEPDKGQEAVVQESKDVAEETGKAEPEAIKSEPMVTEETIDVEETVETENGETEAVETEETIEIKEENKAEETVEVEDIIETVEEDPENNKNYRKKQSIIEKIKQMWYSVVEKVKKIFSSASELKKTVDRYLCLLDKEQTKEAISFLKKKFVKVLRHIGPRKIRGHAYFGMEDPYTTGQIAGICAMALPIYKDNFEIVPNFEEVQLDVEASLKGHIRLGYLLLVVIQILIHRNIHYVIRGIKKIRNSGGKEDGRK